MKMAMLWICCCALWLVGAIRAQESAAQSAQAADPHIAEIASLKAQLASAQADLKATQIEFQLQLQVCNAPERMAAQLAATEAHKAEAAKPTP